MLFAQSCIVADPPEYRVPVRTRPLLEVYKASPPIKDIVVWSTGEPVIQFTVPVRSEDAGEPLSAVTFLDYNTSTELFVNIQTMAASTYDQSREVVSIWNPGTALPVPDPDRPSTCHVLTLVVAHRSSFKSTDGIHLDQGKAGDDAAMVSWWANINAAPDQLNTLIGCPKGSPAAQ